MEPLLPEISPGIEDLGLRVLRGASSLQRALPGETAAVVAEVLRITNCYYSNRIEGHNTHPADIERAMRDQFAENPTIRVLQREALAHIEVQKLVEKRIRSTSVDVCDSGFLRWVHKEFYDRVPEDLRFVEAQSGRKEPVIPGALRHHDVIVGRHHPPPYADLPSFLTRFSEGYRADEKLSVRRIVALAASHHRLMWIHPFSDGNGRVTRLFSLAYAEQAGLSGGGLWSIARGLARRRGDYMAQLASADSLRQNAYDGRGGLSEKALQTFCEFFLDVCLDQINYMAGLLDLQTLGDRFVRYAQLRATGTAIGPTGAAAFRPEAGLLLRETMFQGLLPRGDAPAITGLGRTTSGLMVKSLIEEGLLTSESPKGPLRLGLPEHSRPYLFPELFPEATTTGFQTV
jgi:Fic family protein